jgi:hypothetical protein
MRGNEKFVIEAMVESFSATWQPGEDPPDAYMDFGSGSVAVEISTLTQHVVSDRGTRERSSDDVPAIRLANELNDELQQVIPAGTYVYMHLSPPIMKYRKTKKELAQLIATKSINDPNIDAELKIELFGNDISLTFSQDGSGRTKKISAIISNRDSSADILQNAIYTLGDRIAVKSKKCARLKTRPIWLGLFNDYWLADIHTYAQAMREISRPHIFDRIVVISGDRSVSTLYDRSTAA